jgi:GMP synthase (glutamine-hydrolysing)
MKVLILKNTGTEGPGTIEDYLRQEGISYRIADLSAAEDLPNAADFDALVMLGGPMSVNDALPYIREEERLANVYMDGGRKVLGICLGAQIMAKALGAKVYKGPATEVGWHDITLCDEGLTDPSMMKLASYSPLNIAGRRLKVFQWHGETFDIPGGGQRLACSELYPNQAFRYGTNAYAFQFHMEVTAQMIYDWMSEEDMDKHALKAETGQLYDTYRKGAFAFYRHFFSDK